MRFLATLLCLLLPLSSQLHAQSKSFQSLINQFVGTDTPAVSGPPPSEQLTWIKEQLKASQAQLEQLQNDGSSADLVLLAEQIVRNQTFSQTTLEDVIRLEGELNELKDKPAPTPPTKQTELDAAKKSVADFKSQLAATASEQPLIEQALAEAASSLQVNETAILQLKAAPADQQKLAQLRAEASRNALFNLKWRQYLGTLHTQLNEIELQQLERSIDISRLDVQLNANRAKEALERLGKDRAAVSEQLAKAQKTAEALNQQLYKLQEQTKQGEAPSPVKAQIAILKNSIGSTNQLAVGLDGTLQLIDLEAKHWNTVQSLSTSSDPALFQQMRESIQQDLTRASQMKSALLQRFQDTTRTLERLTDRSDANWQEKSQRPLLEKHQEIVTQLVQTLRDLLQRVEQFSASEQQLAVEVEERLLAQSFKEKSTVTLRQLWSIVVTGWNFPLFVSQGTVFTIGKLIIGFLGLIFAATIASFVSKRAGHTASRRFRSDPTKVVLVEKWVYYLALILLVLTVLNWLSIPLTVFAFLGGALAIGIGFGGQNLMNNFISGIILLFERRVNVGDIVEVDGHTGKVVHLGSRSSRIRKFDGVDVLVPNSYFLEKNVVNWTLSDPNHRYDFIVGIAYGSPVEKCLELFQRVLEAHPHILKDPAPFVFFENFGDNTLDFHFFYWLPVNDSAIVPGRVGSELRTRIAAVCEEAEIEIAYPQRDVHLFTGKPIEIKLQSEKPRESAR